VKGKRCIEEIEAAMERRIWIGLLLVVLASLSALLFFSSYTMHPSEAGFRIYSLQNNAVLVSDADILSYNWTSQEMAITPEASERLTKIGDLYSFTGFVIKTDGEEIYRGIFREHIMSATPASPRISILFPSVLFPSESINYGAIRMFFPFFQPPSDQPVNNAKIFNYFEKIEKLEY
jgi:hypothetical protein